MGSLPAAQPEPAARIADRYEVVRTLGKGGMATVYEVVDASNHERLALKQLLLSAEEVMPRARTLFQREYHALCQLAHPCIVAVRDYGLDAHGPYYTMELLDGQDLRALAPMPWLQACRLMCDVASCLGMLHARGLLHRDVHYRNVRCTSDGRARLLDFGTLSTFGTASDVAGMSPFVAPEALRGQPLDARCDIYSLGCLIYWLLTGQHAFPAFKHDELEGLWARGTPRLSAQLPEVPAALDALLASMMALDPMARPGSAAEVIHRLGAIAGLPHGTRDASRGSYLQRPRLLGREREVERLRLVVSQHLRAPAPAPAGFSPEDDVGATGRFRPVGSRATGSLRSRSRPAAEWPLLVIEGPAGSGRSRMLQELLLEARLSGATVLSISAAALRSHEYAVINAILLQLHRLRPEIESAVSKEDIALLLDADDRPAGPMRRATGVTYHDDRPVRKQRVMRDVLLHAARGKGLLLAIDDFEACDVASAALLASLLEAASGKQVVVGVALRTGVEVSAPAVVEWLRERGRVMTLRALDQAEIEALLRSLFGPAPHLKLLADWVAQTGSGNPLACMELVRHLVDNHVIRYEHGAWLLPPRPAAHGLPPSLRSALKALVDGLPPAARTLAETFCMFDAPLALERCVELSGAGEAAAFEALDELVARNVVVGDGVRYRLLHRELRDTLLESMQEDKRRALHLRVGHWLHERGRRPLEAAWHLMEGGAEVEGAALLVKTSRAGAGVVVTTALRTGERGTRVLRRALDVCDRTPLSPADRTHFAVSCMTVEAFLEHGDLSRAKALITQLERDAGLAGWAERDPTLDPARWVRHAFKAAHARHEQTPEHERGLAPSEAVGLLPFCIMHLSRAFAARGDVAALDRLVHVIEPYGHMPHPFSKLVWRHVHGLHAHLTGRLHGAQTELSEVLYELERMDRETAGPKPPTGVWRTEIGLCLSMTLTPDSDRAFAVVESVDHRGLMASELETTVNRMLRHLFRGEQDTADELAERMERLLVQRPGGGFQNRGWMTTYAAAAYAAIGDAQGLQQAVAQLERLVVRYPGHAPTLEVMRAALHRLRGELDEARIGYEQVLRTYGPIGRIGPALEALPGLVQALRAQERWGEALQVAEHWLDEVGPPDDGERPRLRRMLLPELSLCRARSAGAEGAATAAAELQAALEQAGEEPLWRFRLHAARAAVALEQGEAELVQQHLRLAGKHARAAGSNALVVRHEAFAEQLGRRRRALE